MKGGPHVISGREVQVRPAVRKDAPGCVLWLSVPSSVQLAVAGISVCAHPPT